MIGTDIECVERFAAMKPDAAVSFLTEREEAYWHAGHDRAETLAGFWCAKEAVVKALGTGFGEIGYRGVEIRYRAGGQPYATVPALGLEMEVSISHARGFCIAVAQKT